MVKKKTVRSPKSPESPPISMEESIKKEEHKPVITQVVEVVEDEPVALEETVPAEAQQSVKEETPMTPENPMQDEKRKELVDELFEKKATPSLEVMPEISTHASNKTKPIVLWAITMIVACLVVGGMLLVILGKTGSLPSVVVIPTPTSTPTSMVTPTPSPAEVKRELLTIQVLNGGGKAGAATKMKKSLEDKGYQVTDTGNAPSYTYDKTEILVKPAKKAYIALLEQDLKDSYTLGSSAATLEDSVSYDARVIVGK